MITIIPTEIGVTLKSTLPIEQNTLLKLNNPANAERISAHLKDIGVQQEITEEKDVIYHNISYTVYQEMPAEKFQKAVSKLEQDHDNFLEDVSLRMEAPEEQPKKHNKDKHPEETTESKMQLAAEAMLKGLEDYYDDKDILLIGQQFGPILQSVCEVRVDFLKEVLKKYLNGKS